MRGSTLAAGMRRGLPTISSMPWRWRSGVAMQTKGMANAMKRLTQVRGSREPGAGRPRVHSSST